MNVLTRAHLRACVCVCVCEAYSNFTEILKSKIILTFKICNIGKLYTVI